MKPRFSGKRHTAKREFDDMVKMLSSVDLNNKELLKHLHIPEDVANKYKVKDNYDRDTKRYTYNAIDFWNDVIKADNGNHYKNSNYLTEANDKIKREAYLYSLNEKEYDNYFSGGRLPIMSYPNMIDNVLTNMYDNKKESFDNLFEFGNAVNKAAVKYKCSAFTKQAEGYLNNFKVLLKDSDKHSFRNSELSGQMYKKIHEMLDDINTNKSLDLDKLDDLAVLATGYLKHKVDDGYNRNAYGKIVVADGILNFYSQIIGKQQDHKINWKMNDSNIENIIDNFKKNNPLRNNSEKTKVSFSSLLSDEIGKDKRDKTRTKAFAKETPLAKCCMEF